MRRPSPLVQMTMTLVGICGTLLLLADLLFGVLPNQETQSNKLRHDVAKALAVQVASLLQGHDRDSLQRTLDGVAASTDGVASLAIRQADGSIVMQAGDHRRHWREPGAAGQPGFDQIVVPLNAGGTPWGSFEVAFQPDRSSTLARFVRQPLIVTLLFISVAGSLTFGLYMRRTLQHLDHAAVIPERVQQAFDAMAEGVVVVDARGRVQLANMAFRTLSGRGDPLRIGQDLASLPWLAPALPDDVQAHPWLHTMNTRTPTSGHALVARDADDMPRHLVVNCAPITDAGRHVRGCLVTFNDVSELHRVNHALRDAMRDLECSRGEVQRQNLELERLATRDPMTGCMNRRSFDEAFAALFEAAQRQSLPLSCVMVDIDHFKAINDNHGHAIGDRAIQEVAKRLLESVRSADLVCRCGGEGFCVVMPGADQAEMVAFAERVRQRIDREAGPGVREKKGMRITVSLGVASLKPSIASGAELIDLAVQALHRAKRAGRNQVQAFAGAGPTGGRPRDARADRVAPATATATPAITESQSMSTAVTQAQGLREEGQA